ncbi:MAG: hypothetical protein GY858_01940 [Candidatus Omnitrophica bacterium]|nr:hypothetical protein [Candidatus Omnitrophota bacterium]
MKSVYSVGDDFFIAMAFVSFVVGIGLRILSVSRIAFGINYKEVLFFSVMCLLFSIALSLYELNQAR